MVQPLVIVVPGFTGSALRKVKGFGRVRQIWANRTELAVNGPDNLDLDYPGPAPGPLAGGPLEPAGQLAEGPYLPLMERLSALGYHPTFFDYDWRLGIKSTGQQLANVLLADYKTADIAIISHSMGGLVARWAYSRWLPFSNPARWVRSIYIAVPHGGSYGAVAGLSGYSPDFGLTGFLAVTVGLVVRRVLNPTGSQQSLQDRYNQVLASWPGLYDLLPSNEGPWSGVDPQAEQVNRQPNYSNYNFKVIQSRLDASFQTRLDLAHLLTEARPPEVSVFASGVETPSEVDDRHKFGEIEGYKYSSHGDGVVTVERAALPLVNGVELDATHQQMPSNARFLSIVGDLIENGLPAPLDLPNAQLPNPPIKAPPSPGAEPVGPWKGELAPVPPRPIQALAEVPTPVGWPRQVRGDP